MFFFRYESHQYLQRFAKSINSYQSHRELHWFSGKVWAKSRIRQLALIVRIKKILRMSRNFFSLCERQRYILEKSTAIGVFVNSYAEWLWILAVLKKMNMVYVNMVCDVCFLMVFLGNFMGKFCEKGFLSMVCSSLGLW